MKIFNCLDINGTFYILKNQKKILTPNNFYFSVKKENLAELIIKELNKFGNIHIIKTPISHIAYFSCNINKTDKKKIINEIIENLYFDNLLYRSSNPNKLNKLMKKNFDNHILYFNKKFSLNLEVKNNFFSYQTNQKVNQFSKYLDGLCNYEIALVYKLCKISKSVILSYSFFEKKINLKKFISLICLESDFQKKKWGATPEQEIVDKDLKINIKNYSIFFKNLY